VANVTAGLLDSCQKTRTCPKIIQLSSSAEYWNSGMSLGTTDALGRQDMEIPENVRIYLFSSTQHAPASKPVAGICRNIMNPNPYRETFRALIVALKRWVTEGAEPPPSRIPTLRDKTLVHPDKESVGWPDIPGVEYTGLFNQISVIDYGSLFNNRNVSGITAEPPKADANYTMLVPRVDIDGNEISGIRSTTLQAPLGTYTGWNLRRAGFGEGGLCLLNGLYIPFKKTQAERLAAGDPRLSLEERYGDHNGYVATVQAAAERLVAQRFLLPEEENRGQVLYALLCFICLKSSIRWRK